MQPQTFVVLVGVVVVVVVVVVLVGVVVVVTLNDHTVTQILDSSYS
jgi:hypothetical protein